MKVWVLGSGAREHALGWRLRRDGASAIVFSPGNGGTALVGDNQPCDLGDMNAVVALAQEIKPDLVVVGPEAPLVAGVADGLRAAGFLVFGPGAEGARLEASKVWSKAFMERHGVPTGEAHVFDAAEGARGFVQGRGRPWVVKADGLAAGKGVVVASTVSETLEAIDGIMNRRVHGAAGDRVLLEEVLVGEELSVHAVSDGRRFALLPAAQDHKRAQDGDRGPNTGGMGAYVPAPIFTEALERRVCEEVLGPTFSGLKKEGVAFRGVLFVGLMVVDGAPRVLEYNVRFGDPECACLMMSVQGNVLELLLGCAQGGLKFAEDRFRAGHRPSLCVVMASEGYPGKAVTGRGISFPPSLPSGVEVFHGGTVRADGGWVTCGGRVLAVTATGETLQRAADRVYGCVDDIDFEGAQHRRDIGWRALA